MRSRWFLISLAAAGLMLSTIACADEKKGKDEEDEGNETQVKFVDLPAPVQTTINRESENAKIDTVDKEDHHGKFIYEADAKLHGHNYEIKVAEDGTLVSKKLDEEDEKDEKK
jgi:hypothetical protein